MPRNIHAKSVHLRLATIHSWSSRPVTSAATANANGHRAADEARVEARRVDDHPVVLEERVQPLAVGARARDAGRERVRREGHEHAEEEDDRHQRRDDVRLKLEVASCRASGRTTPMYTLRRNSHQRSEPSCPPQSAVNRYVERHRRGPSSGRRSGCGSRGVTNAYARQRTAVADERDRSVRAEPRGLERSRAPVRAGRERDRERVARDDHRRRGAASYRRGGMCSTWACWREA